MRWKAFYATMLGNFFAKAGKEYRVPVLPDAVLNDFCV